MIEQSLKILASEEKATTSLNCNVVNKYFRMKDFLGATDTYTIGLTYSDLSPVTQGKH